MLIVQVCLWISKRRAYNESDKSSPSLDEVDILWALGPLKYFVSKEIFRLWRSRFLIMLNYFHPHRSHVCFTWNQPSPTTWYCARTNLNWPTPPPNTAQTAHVWTKCVFNSQMSKNDSNFNKSWQTKHFTRKFGSGIELVAFLEWKIAQIFEIYNRWSNQSSQCTVKCQSKTVA